MEYFLSLRNLSAKSVTLDFQTLCILERNSFFDALGEDVFLEPFPDHIRESTFCASAIASRYWHLCRVYGFDKEHALERQYCLALLTTNWSTSEITAYRDSFITSIEEYIKLNPSPISLAACLIVGTPHQDLHALYKVLSTEHIVEALKKSVLSGDDARLSNGLLYELAIRGEGTDHLYADMTCPCNGMAYRTHLQKTQVS